MRITLTLDPDVARVVAEEAHRQHKPFNQVVNEAIRRGLAPHVTGQTPPRYEVRPHRTKLQPGIDAGSFNKLVDELEDEAIVGRTR